jgi:uncharacterized protein YjdB
MMKKKFIYTLILVLIAYASTYSKVIYNEPATPLSLTTINTSGSGLTIDIDGTSFGDLQFRYDKSTTNGNWFFHAQPYINISLIGCDTKNNSYGLPYVSIYHGGESFGSTSNFQSSPYYHPLIGDVEDPNFLNKGKKYMGFQFKLQVNGPMHYGWMEIELTENGSDKTLTIYGWAYEDVAGNAITIGDKGNGGSNIEITSIELSSPYYKISNKGGSMQIQADILPQNATNKTLTWSVNDPDLASIDQSGLLTAKNDGTVIISALATDGSLVWDSLYINLTNQADIMVSSITINEQDVTLAPGASKKLSVSILPANATNKEVLWSVDDNKLAMITDNGKITALREGTVTVKAKSKDGSGVSGTVEVNIIENTSGFEEVTAENEIKIYPVPSSGIVTLKNEGQTVFLKEVTIYDLKGSEVFCSLLNNKSSVCLNLSHLNKGQYIMNISLSDNSVSRKKLILF